MIARILHLVALMGLLAPVSGRLWPVVVAALGAACAADWLPDRVRRWPSAPFMVVSLAGMGTLASLGVDKAAVVCVGLAGLVAAQALWGDGETGRRTLGALGVLVVLATATLEPGPGWALLAALWMASLPLVLAPAAPKWLGVAAAVVGLGVTPFVPRWSMPMGGEDPDVAATGFTESSELGRLQTLIDDPSVVLRVRFDAPVDGPVYLRGVALEQFDGRRWTTGGFASLASPTPGEGTTARFTSVEPSAVLFTAGRVLDVQAASTVARDTQGAWKAMAGAPLREWSVVFDGNARPGEVAVDEALVDPSPYLALPNGLDPRIDDLVDAWAPPGTPPVDGLNQLVVGLRSHAVYSRTPDDVDAVDPLATFLFDARAGYCEYFAASLAVLARRAGLPARVVNGYVGGDATGPLSREFRRLHAHSWVEVYLEGRGWVTVDATPGPILTPEQLRTGGPGLSVTQWLDQQWSAWVAFGPDEQQAALAWVVRVVVPSEAPAWLGWSLLAAPWVGLVVWFWARLRRLIRVSRAPVRPTDAIHRRLLGAVAHLAHQGVHCPPSMPWRSWAVGESELPSDVRGALIELIDLHYRVRYGEEGAEGLVAQAQSASQVVLGWKP